MMNTDYITVNEHGVFVGGKPSKTYRGVEITDIEMLINAFKSAKVRIKQTQNLDIKAFHVLSSESGKNTKFPPSNVHGTNIWFRAELVDGTHSKWVYVHPYEDLGSAAIFCALCDWESYQFEPVETWNIIGIGNSAEKALEETLNEFGRVWDEDHSGNDEDFVDDDIIKSKDSEGFTILGFESEYDVEKQEKIKENVLKQIKFGPFLITIQRRVKQK